MFSQNCSANKNLVYNVTELYLVKKVQHLMEKLFEKENAYLNTIIVQL
jgi:hypothetical protein